ncbi:MAG: hypothetical protein ABJG95_02710 [Rhizobiaceae bacterium]
MWTSTNKMEQLNNCDTHSQRETCAHRNDTKRLRQAGCVTNKCEDGPSYISSATMSAMDIYPY